MHLIEQSLDADESQQSPALGPRRGAPHTVPTARMNTRIGPCVLLSLSPPHPECKRREGTRRSKLLSLPKCSRAL